MRTLRYTVFMIKTNPTQQFGDRLKEALINAGYHSPRSLSGIDIHMLVYITGYSSQICRKYLRNEALPEPAKLIEIAAALNVSPGWLLFGENFLTSPGQDNKDIKISKQKLHALYAKAAPLYQTEPNLKEVTAKEIADFLIDLTQELSTIEASESQINKMIDLALASAMHFKKQN